MKWIFKNIIPILLIATSLGIAIKLSNSYDYADSTIIEYTFVANTLLALFSVLLTIVALIITLLDKYKEKGGETKTWLLNSTNILKELSENTIFLLFLYVATVSCSIFDTVLSTIIKINIIETVLLFSLIMAIIITFDTTISVYQLVVNLKQGIFGEEDSNITLSQDEKHLIEAYRFLDKEHKKTLEGLMRSLSVDQQIQKHD